MYAYATGRPLALVTGASSGIGYELARQFAEHGYDLVIAAEDAGIDEAAVRLARDGGPSIDAVRVDLATAEGVERLWDWVASTGRPVDAVAINAGAGVSGDFIRETVLDDELTIVDLNCRSTVHLAKRVLPAMADRGRGRVLFTSSIASAVPGSLMAVYSASKSFVQSFAEALRDELRDTGVTVTSLMPAVPDTGLFERADMLGTRVGSGPEDDPTDVARQGFEALMKGDDHVVAGPFRNTVQAVAAKAVPDAARAEMFRRMAEPDSGSPG